MRIRVPVVSLLASALIVATTCGASLREDEFLCEEAHARLVACCPGFSVESSWCTWDGGCGAGASPALAPEESRCVARASCDELRSAGVCERAAARPRPTDETDVSSWEPVCK